MSLSQVEKALKKDYYIENVDELILHVSLNKKELPFAMIAIEDNNLIVSFSSDLNNPELAVDIALKVCYIGNTLLGEAFYITDEGGLLFGDEAHAANELMSGDLLKDLEPISKAIN